MTLNLQAVFITGDIISLVIQGVGGGVASSGTTDAEADKGGQSTATQHANTVGEFADLLSLLFPISSPNVSLRLLEPRATRHQLTFRPLSSPLLSIVGGVIVQMVVMTAFSLVLIDFVAHYLRNTSVTQWRPFSCLRRRRSSTPTPSDDEMAKPTQLSPKAEKRAKIMLATIAMSTVLIFIR